MSTQTIHSAPLPVAVIGCGRMGRYHARAYSQMPGAKLVGVYDAAAARAAAVAAECGTVAAQSVEQLLKQVRAVTVAVPTRHHFAAAEPFLKQGIGCLIEKPLAPTAEEGQRILDAARGSGAILQVGHIERFNPALRALAALNLRPRFLEATRVSPLTFRSIDVGVVLDMMIHDLDIVLKLAGAPLEDIDASGASVIGQVEDICSARLRFANGCVANVTASRLALKTERKLRFFSRDAYVSLDYQKRSGAIVRREPSLSSLRDTAAALRSGAVADPMKLEYASMVKVEPLVVQEADALRAQLENFLGAVAGKNGPEVTGEDGLAAVDVACRIGRIVAEQMQL